MPQKRTTKDSYLRQQLAQEAAKIMLESGIRDFAMAKRKAATRLGINEMRQLPSNQEIEQARIDYQQIFYAGSQRQHLLKLRQVAVQAMQFLQEFKPRLVGAALSGSADMHTPVTLHVFTDTSEEINLRLLEKHIPFELQQKRLKLSNDNYQCYPCFQFIADDIHVQLLVFPLSKRSPIPISQIDNKPVQRANLQMVKTLIEEQLSQITP